MRIAIVVGEISGDMLGAGLMKALRKQYPNAKFEGIGGEQMEQLGFQSFVPMERLAVMGLVEILGRLFELLKVRKDLVRYWQKNPPDIFIGIDAPEFNTDLELKLRESGIKTVHYVSPSVWTWREKRIFKIKKAVDLMLTLFPFETGIYKEHKVPVKFVGHHLADSIDIEQSPLSARQALRLATQDKVVCLMPGSRGSEVAKLGPVFIATAKKLLAKDENIKFVMPAANGQRYDQLEKMLADENFDQHVELVLADSQTCMKAADSILMASGTATLEGLLLKKPMVVSYIVSPISAFLFRRLLKQPFISLPNLLAGRELIPEILQEEATAENLSKAVHLQLEDYVTKASLQQEYLRIHNLLRCDANQQAADAIIELIESSAGKEKTAKEQTA